MGKRIFSLHEMNPPANYRGRIAPSPTGYLHLGHALTFWTAFQRARENGGELVLRIEDLDAQRCKPEFRDAIFEDLKWFGISWDEGPDRGGPFGPYTQSERRQVYVDAWEKLRAGGFIYPCKCSRKDVMSAIAAPHESAASMPQEGEDEPIYPGTCRTPPGTVHEAASPAGVTWRFRVPQGEAMEFRDGRMGPQRAVAGKDFGDFVVWRRDDVPAYQLAVVADDAAMRITEVVRGEDLLTSTFRQLLIYRALGIDPPAFHHCPLVRDEKGERLAKRNAALSLRALRTAGKSAEELRG
ncbi:MAG TPA: tRNA glutamyl-Q(34) synthetase GluQRS [Chthoniobacteraceae bacterium]|nr:tRNA glutamyl-Q(34) synthetase GluQRS [Chthoniobacteraceae bacterium]